MRTHTSVFFLDQKDMIIEHLVIIFFLPKNHLVKLRKVAWITHTKDRSLLFTYIIAGNWLVDGIYSLYVREAWLLAIKVDSIDLLINHNSSYLPGSPELCEFFVTGSNFFYFFFCDRASELLNLAVVTRTKMCRKVPYSWFLSPTKFCSFIGDRIRVTSRWGLNECCWEASASVTGDIMYVWVSTLMPNSNEHLSSN